MNEHELLLFDRLEIIKTTVNKYGEENFYISFSGGKDSTMLHYLVDQAIPGNKIPRVFINTGIEYNDIVNFVKGLAQNDERFVILNPPFNFDRTGCKGWPFALHLQDQLNKMELFLPNERKQCEMIWKPVYDEYRRIGYRLKDKSKGE